MRGHFETAIEEISSEVQSRGGTVTSSVSDTSGFVRASDGCRCLEWRIQLLDGRVWIEVTYDEAEKPLRARFEIDLGCSPATRISGNFLNMYANYHGYRDLFFSSANEV